MKFILSNNVINCYLNANVKPDNHFSIVSEKDYFFCVDEISMTKTIYKQSGIYETVYYGGSLDNKIGCVIYD